ncbi:MAG: hypothetical protein J6P79_09480 [Pseudobutyrivibrio sp.]|nr:hypothetical protein [Pseudobutyrivibrio sp.]
MLLFKENDEQKLKRISKSAGNVVQMFNAYFKTPKGIDATMELVFVAAMAGHACHRSVIAQHGKIAEVTTKDGRKFYFGDDLNKYLLENKFSVVSFCTAVTDYPKDKVIEIVTSLANHFTDENYTVCGNNPKSLYEQVESCWESIYNNMTAKYCKDSSEWPILFGVVLQNILMMSIKAGAPKDEATRVAIECAVAVSKMDKESF